MQEETKLFWKYVISCCLFIISLITCSLPWSHWAYTINMCPGFDCECILFGRSFADHFAGGKAIYCQLLTFLQIPVFLTAACLSFYQGRQCLIIRRVRKRMKLRSRDSEKNPILILKSRNGRILKEGDIIIENKEIKMEPPKLASSITLVVISLVCCLIILGLYILMVVGYQWSCNEYRKMMVQLLKASGNMAQILTERLECTAIFDFMDYLQPKRRIVDPADYGRKAKINTGYSLFLGQLSLLNNFILWVFIAVNHIKTLRKRIQDDRNVSPRKRMK